MNQQVIYLDYNATTPIDPAVASAMQPFIATEFGNPSSSHPYGRRAKEAIENARDQVASMLGCSSDEIYFTSGGTESNNIAIHGFAQANEYKGNHIITSAVEHPAVLEVCKDLEKRGFDLTILPVDEKGSIRTADLERAIREDTILISVMHANNEVGTIQPISEITIIAHSHNAVVHTDAAQSVGKIPVDVKDLGADMLSLAGHKLYAPKGIGALFVRKGTSLQKIMFGASHEMNLRPGTENVIGIVGLGKACELITENLQTYAAHFENMRDLLESLLSDANLNYKINGDINDRLPNTSSLSFYGEKANQLLEKIPQVAASAGAACHAEKTAISHVLEAMHVPVDYALGTIRVSTGRDTSEGDIQKAAQHISKIISAASKY